MKLPSDVVVGQYLQLICLCIGAAIAAVYAAGYVTGTYLHQLNNVVSKGFLFCLLSSRQIKPQSYTNTIV